MARPSNLPTFPNLTIAQDALTHDPSIVARTLRTKSGAEYTDLTRRMHAEDSRCVSCNLPTLFTRWDGPQSAILAHLIPSAILLALTDPDLYSADTLAGAAYRALRAGWAPGNLALMCNACSDAAGAYAATTGGMHVWHAATLAGAERVWCAWPRGITRASKPAEPTGDDFRAVVRAARTHAANAARARAASGLPF